jgi:hypothetical protein
MSDTCRTCGQELPAGNSNLSVLIQNSCNDESKWYTGWDAVWNAWSVGDSKYLGDDRVLVEKVYETDSDNFDGYDSIPIEMVFAVSNNFDMEFWKITGEWSSYDGKEWNGMFSKVEKKERTSVYYG